jgi:zinc transporter, ZIP family
MGYPNRCSGFSGSGGGGTVTDLIPEAEERHYQQSAAVAIAVGFMLIFILSGFL